MEEATRIIPWPFRWFTSLGTRPIPEEEEELRASVVRALLARRAEEEDLLSSSGKVEEEGHPPDGRSICWLEELHRVLLRYNHHHHTNASANSNLADSSPSSSEWKRQIRPLMEKCLLLAALSDPQKRPPEMPVSLYEVLDAMIAFDPSLLFVGQNEEEDPRMEQRLPHGRRNLLHRVVLFALSGPNKADLVRYVLGRRTVRDGAARDERGSNELVASLDFDGMRPIDILTAQILMKEERLKYFRKRGRRQKQRSDLEDEKELARIVSDLDDSWECARMIANVHAGAHHLDELPVVHACVRASSLSSPGAHAAAATTARLVTSAVPRALLESSLRRYPHQLCQSDSTSNVPLHHAAAAWAGRDTAAHPVAGCDDDNDDEDEVEEEDDVLSRILALNRGAARVRNGEGQCPFDVAVRAGRTWRTGLAVLGSSYPEAMLDASRDRDLLPLLVATLRSGADNGLSSRQAAHILYRLIRASPNALVPPPEIDL